MGKQSGFLMMVIAVLLVVVGGLATAFVSMIVSGTNSTISTISANNAFDLAKTGIESGAQPSMLLTKESINTVAVKIKLQPRLPVH